MQENDVKTPYKKYPLSIVLLYNGTTILHYLTGYFGIAAAFSSSLAGTVISGAYLLFAVGQMYLLMPLTVCPNCAYHDIKGWRCVSGLNILSSKIALNGSTDDFHKRAKGLLCHNHLYMAALVIPIIIMLPYLFINFSLTLLGALVVVILLTLYRIFHIFPKLACNRCLSKGICPNAKSMNIN